MHSIEKKLPIKNMDNLSIPSTEINLLPIQHVDKLFIPHTDNFFCLYDI